MSLSTDSPGSDVQVLPAGSRTPVMFQEPPLQPVLIPPVERTARAGSISSVTSELLDSEAAAAKKKKKKTKKFDTDDLTPKAFG